MSSPSKKRRLLLIGWDSADWKLIQPLVDQGAMPGMERLLNTGVSGNITTLEPQLSPMLWTSIATGKHAYHHGVHGFTEVDPLSGQIVPVSAATRQCQTVWEILGERGLRSHVVSWFATQGERDLNGKMVSNMFNHLRVKQSDAPSAWPPPMPGTYWPENLGETMNELRISPWEMDGDEVLRLFVPDAPKIDQKKDRRLWQLAEKLAEAYSVHSAATHLMATDPEWDFMAVYYRAIDEISHFFMPYHPPKMEGIPEADFAMYQNVVTSAYRAHDVMLQRLLYLAGPDTAIVLVSDHGFHSDHLRPKFMPRVPAGITVWHRPQGVFVAAGPGFRKDELIYGARLLDVTPTVLTYFGLPVGEDMEGRVLTEAFETLPNVAKIPTWENPDGPRQRRGSLSETDSKALLEQFEALGYIDKVSNDPTEAAAETRRENQWNLARACLDGGRLEQALPLLEEIHEGRPDRPDYTQVLARCQMRLGLLAEAEVTIDAALKSFASTEGAHLLKANIAIEKEDYPEALRQLDLIRAQNSEDVQLQQLLALTYLQLRQWDHAEAAARQVLAADPHNAQAFLTLARLQLHRQQPAAAMESALEAIGFQYGNPQGHFLLGVALIQLQDWNRAEQALVNALRLNPDFTRANRHLAHVYRQQNEPEKASICALHARVRRARHNAEQEKKNAGLRAELEIRTAARLAARQVKSEKLAQRAAEDAAVPPMDFVLVSGLPRSGTSLMMQMLHAGGLAVMTDGQRVADEDNLEGYWEWEDIKKLPKNPRIIEQAEGKVIKVISALLAHLPPKHRYKIIFMRRPLAEVVRSQWAMLARHGQAPKSEADHLMRTQETHVENLLSKLRQSPCIQLLEVDFPQLVREPAPWIEKITHFIGADRLPTAAAMITAVKPKLHRQKG